MGSWKARTPESWKAWRSESYQSFAHSGLITFQLPSLIASQPVDLQLSGFLVESDFEKQASVN
jgi:hypothetical protein